MALLAAQKITNQLKKAFGKEFGDDCVTYLGSTELEKIPRLHSQCVAVDKALGGGWPLGRICEVFGGESSGKTTLCYHADAEAQKVFPDSAVGFVDTEHSLDPLYAKACGVDIAQLVISQPSYAEMALTIIEGMIEAGCKLVILDSVAALAPKAEVEGEFTDIQPGLQARLMAKAMRKLTALVNKAQAVVIFTNQIRDKIGVSYGNPETTAGGRALRYHASIRLKLTGLGAIEDGQGKEKAKAAIRVRCEAVKNKTAPPYRRGEYVIRFGQGIDNEGLYFEQILENNLIRKEGNSIYWVGDVKINGRPKLKAYLEANPESYADLKKKVDDGVVIPVDEPETESELDEAPPAETDENESGEV